MPCAKLSFAPPTFNSNRLKDYYKFFVLTCDMIGVFAALRLLLEFALGDVVRFDNSALGTRSGGFYTRPSLLI